MVLEWLGAKLFEKLDATYALFDFLFVTSTFYHALQLIEHGVQTSVLSRTPETLSSDPLFKDCTLHRGDVSSMDSLLQASSGCDAIISLQS